MNLAFPLFLLLASATRAPAFAADNISLSRFLELASASNPGLKKEAASASAARAASAGLAIPAPMAALTRMTDSSGSAGGYEISQTIPFPTRLTGDHSARVAEADAREAAFHATEAAIRGEARLVYFRLWQTQEKIAFLKEKKAVLESHLRLTGAATRSDSFLQVHKLKTESDLDLLENELLEAQQQAREAQARAAEFLDRDPASFQLVAEEIPPADLPGPPSLAHPYSLEARELALDAMESRLTEARSGWLPDFNLRFRKTGSTPMTKGFSEVMVGVSLPFVFFWEPNAASGKAAAERLEAEADLALEKRNVEARRATLLTRAASLKKQLEQFREKLLPRAEKRLRLVHNLAPRDMETLQDHRETMEAVPELKLKALETRTAYEEAVAELQRLAR